MVGKPDLTGSNSINACKRSHRRTRRRQDRIQLRGNVGATIPYAVLDTRGTYITFRDRRLGRRRQNDVCTLGTRFSSKGSSHRNDAASLVPMRFPRPAVHTFRAFFPESALGWRARAEGLTPARFRFPVATLSTMKIALIQEALVQSALEVFAKPDLTRVLCNSEY